jgi:2-oxoglutarate ferredoxin oxidoreductase subunit delta
LLRRFTPRNDISPNVFVLNGDDERRSELATLKIYYELCKGVDECGICIYVCPKEVFKPSETLNQKGYRPPVVAQEDECTGCENCMIFCPDLAIVVSEEKMQRRAKK